MFSRNIPDILRHARIPGVKGFAVLNGIEASLRGLLVSIWPLVLYRALSDDAAAVSLYYFGIGVSSLFFGLMVPWIGRFLPRRWVYTAGVGFYLIGCPLAILGGPVLTPLALLLTSLATVTVSICTNAYVMDYIARHDLGRGESLKMIYAAVSWAAGPVIGVMLWKYWEPLPFLAAMGFAALLLATFWYMRLGNGKLITRARAPAPNPLAYLARFFRQPRLIAGWLFAVLRSSGWWVYIVYLPIFCIEAGLGDQVASAAFSVSNTFLFLSPLMLRWMQRRGLKRAIRITFAACAACFLLAAFGQVWPPLAVIALFTSSLFLVMLDAFGSLPFLMAVRPAERTEMSAVYSSYRDVSGILSPGVAWLVLLALPITGVFAACAGGLASMIALAGRIHPRLGEPRGAKSEQPA
ncbi:MFS transporter [Defluviimonas salinarum]|uniref:MFS transporter n=1 Tax=Defluviimonas salinarum TaxID=2992147 RepID=A0ABT3IYQ5_9RHOB|nr:MFS transporter [Defluviimonas salinarum]MCW3780540.1 MFS transporter [Defluviimonas salinarum]